MATYDNILNVSELDHGADHNIRHHSPPATAEPIINKRPTLDSFRVVQCCHSPERPLAPVPRIKQNEVANALLDSVIVGFRYCNLRPATRHTRVHWRRRNPSRGTALDRVKGRLWWERPQMEATTQPLHCITADCLFSKNTIRVRRFPVPCPFARGKMSPLGVTSNGQWISE